MMESDFLFCVYLTFIGFLFMGSALFLLKSLNSPVKAIPAADDEDQAMLLLYCEPEALWEIIAAIEHVGPSRHVSHWQLDCVIKAMHKCGYVAMGPSRREIREAAAMYQERMVS